MEAGGAVDAGTVRQWLETAAGSLREQRDYLTQLDAAIGDADHGTNMDRGFTAVVEKLAGLEGPPGKLLTTAGSTLVSTVGGASGPLWGTALRRAGRSLGEADSFDGPARAAARGPPRRKECGRRCRSRRRRDARRIWASAASGTRTPARRRRRSCSWRSNEPSPQSSERARAAG